MNMFDIDIEFTNWPKFKIEQCGFYEDNEWGDHKYVRCHNGVIMITETGAILHGMSYGQRYRVYHTYAYYNAELNEEYRYIKFGDYYYYLDDRQVKRLKRLITDIRRRILT